MTDYTKYINALRKCAKEHKNDRTFMGYVVVSDLCRDTADLLETLAQEPKIGHWIEVHPLQEDDGGAYMCSKCRCGHPCIDPDYWKYCPNCGARMSESKYYAELSKSFAQGLRQGLQEISNTNMKMWEAIYAEEERRTTESENDNY